MTVGDVKEGTHAAPPKGSAGVAQAPTSPPAPIALVDPNLIRAAVESPAVRARSRERSQAYYELMRERVRVLGAAHAADSVAYYTRNLQETQNFDSAPNRYGLALALTRAGRAPEAIAPLQKLVDADPDNLAYQIALGDAELYAGHRDLALQRYAHHEHNSPNNRALALAHAQALLSFEDKTSAHQAQEVLRPLLAHDDEDPQLHTVYGRAADFAGDKVRAGESYAIASYLNGRAEDAYNQLREIAKRTDLDYYQRKRVEALIEQMTPIVLDLRRRKVKPADQGKLVADPPKSGFSLCLSAACETPSSARNN